MTAYWMELRQNWRVWLAVHVPAFLAMLALDHDTAEWSYIALAGIIAVGMAVSR